MSNSENNHDINKNLLLIVIMIANFFNPFTGSAVNIALPRIAADLGLGAVGMSWVTMSYLLASAVFLVPMGKVADKWGRRSAFIIGNIIFLLSSFACAFSQSEWFLISTRFLQGIGGAMMVSTSMAILMSAFAPSERGKVIGMSVASVYLGLSVAPALGGFITQYIGWRSLFLINGTVSILVAVLIYLSVKTEWKESADTRFDWKGVMWYVPSLTLLMYGFSKLPETDAIIMTTLGLAGIIKFLRDQYKIENPILNVRLFLNNRVFSFSNLSAFINYAATFAVSFVLSLYLQYTRHLTPREAGMILMAQPVLMAIVSVFSGRLSDRINARLMSAIGMAISAVGLFMLTLLGTSTSDAYILASLAVLGFGFGLFSSPNTNVVMSSVTKQHYGIASATLATMRNLGMMFSMAIASLAVHAFVGNRVLGDATIGSFMLASKTIFTLFTVLCVIGVFTSYMNSKNKEADSK